MFENFELMSKALKAWDRFQERRRSLLRPVLLDVARQAKSAPAEQTERVVEQNLESVLKAATPLSDLLHALAELAKGDSK